MVVEGTAVAAAEFGDETVELLLDTFGKTRFTWWGLAGSLARDPKQFVQALRITTDELPELATDAETDASALQLTLHDGTDLVGARVASVSRSRFTTRCRRKRRKCPRARPRCSTVSGTDEHVLEELACPPPSPTVDVPGEPLLEGKPRTFEDLGVEILGIIDHNDHGRACR